MTPCGPEAERDQMSDAQTVPRVSPGVFYLMTRAPNGALAGTAAEAGGWRPKVILFAVFCCFVVLARAGLNVGVPVWVRVGGGGGYGYLSLADN